MGVADNKTYRDQYHFTDDRKVTGEEYPSIKEEPKINTTIKENPYRSNVEIEGNEIVLQPDLTALFKAVGKKHKQGGMDVLLKPNSFVFSDFDGLVIGKQDHDLFELKEGGETPAEVLKKNVDVKHYNNLVNIMTDPFKDDLSKRTAARMLEKYISTLGNIAYIQEEKKGFPQGVPEFAMGTAPVYNSELKNEILSNKQYMKAGGSIGLPKAQLGWWYGMHNKNQVTPPPQNKQTSLNWGLWQGDKLPVFRNRYGVSNAADKISNLDSLATQLGYTGPKSNVEFQKWLYNSSPENKAIIDKWHNQYGEPSIAVPTEKRNRFDDKIGIRWQNAINEILTQKQPQKQPQQEEDQLNISVETPKITKNIPGPQVPNLDVTPQGSKQADWRFTPWQKLSQLYNWGEYANVKRYMPYRSRYNATYVDPALVNPEQAVGDLKGIGNQQLSSLTTLNPILRNAQAASIAGQIMNNIPGVRSQYDNQNAQILNQSRQYNNQVKNNESLVNMANDQTYYQQAIEGRKNFDNMRQFTANNAMNNTLRDVETNQKLAYNLLTQNNPAYGFDWKTGNFTRNVKDIRDVPSNTTNDRYSALLEMVNGITDPIEKAKLAVKLEGLKVFGNARNDSSPFKKGGKTKKNPYRY